MSVLPTAPRRVALPRCHTLCAGPPTHWTSVQVASAAIGIAAEQERSLVATPLPPDSKLWQPLHKYGSLVDQQLRHELREAVHNAVIAALKGEDGTLRILGNEQDVVGDKTFRVADALVRFARGEVVITSYGGYVTQAQGGASTRTPQSDIDVSITFDIEMPHRDIAAALDRVLTVLRRVPYALGPFSDYNLYAELFTTHRGEATSVDRAVALELTRSVTRYSPALDMAAAAICLKFLCQLADDASAAKAIALTPQFADPGADDLVRRVILWYATVAQRPVPVLASSAVAADVSDKARDAELAIYQAQFQRAVAVAELAGGDMFGPERVLTLVQQHALLGLLKLEGYICPATKLLVVFKVSPRELDSRLVFLSAIEQISDGVIKASSTAVRANPVSPTTFKPKVLPRLASALLATTHPNVDKKLNRLVIEAVDSLRVAISVQAGAPLSSRPPAARSSPLPDQTPRLLYHQAMHRRASPAVGQEAEGAEQLDDTKRRMNVIALRGLRALASDLRDPGKCRSDACRKFRKAFESKQRVREERGLLLSAQVVESLALLLVHAADAINANLRSLNDLVDNVWNQAITLRNELNVAAEAVGRPDLIEPPFEPRGAADAAPVDAAAGDF